MSDPSSAQPVRPAATILLLRDTPQFEVLMVTRHHQIDFASGALVFPGGKSHADDHDPAWSGHADGWSDFEPDQRGLRIAAFREVFEEAGLLLARRRDGGPLGAAGFPLELRQAVDAGRTSFLEVVRAHDARLDLHALTVFARWITPKIGVKRFDTWFFAARAPEDQLAVSDGHETVDAEWVTPAEALRLRAVGERTVIFPTRMNLMLLGQAANAEDAIGRARGRTLVTVEPRVEDRPGGKVLVLPPDAGYGVVEELLSNAM